MKVRSIMGAAILALCLAGAVGCDNTQGTSPQSNTANKQDQFAHDDNQNNGAGSGTTEKPETSGGGHWTDPATKSAGARHQYGTGKTTSGSNGS